MGGPEHGRQVSHTKTPPDQEGITEVHVAAKIPSLGSGMGGKLVRGFVPQGEQCPKLGVNAVWPLQDLNPLQHVGLDLFENRIL